MKFETYIKQEGHGSMTKLQMATGVSYSTIHRAFRGKPLNFQTAQKLAKATAGAVSVADLCDPGAAVDPPVPDETADRAPSSADAGASPDAATESNVGPSPADGAQGGDIAQFPEPAKRVPRGLPEDGDPGPAAA
jgi:hypothetical protein